MYFDKWVRFACQADAAATAELACSAHRDRPAREEQL